MSKMTLKNVEGDESKFGRNLGHQLRIARIRSRMTLKTVSEKTGLSQSFLSQIERGKVNASVASLNRITSALGSSVADLFVEDRQPGTRVIRKLERPALNYGILGRKFLLTPTPLANLEIFIGEFEIGGSTGEEPYSHGDSDEMFFVLSGVFEVQVGREKFTLVEGDCVSYRSSLPHKVANVGSVRGEVMWIISPPSF